MAATNGKPESKTRKRQARIFTNNVDISLSADNAVLSLNFGGKAELTVTMPTTQVDKFIDALWKWRIKMQPEHPTDFALGQKPSAIADPRWYTESELKQGGSLIHLRHPGFGWLSFWLPKNEATKLAGFLRAQVEEQEKPPQLGENH
jgi:hypothetical protein